MLSECVAVGSESGKTRWATHNVDCPFDSFGARMLRNAVVPEFVGLRWVAQSILRQTPFSSKE